MSESDIELATLQEELIAGFGTYKAMGPLRVSPYCHPYIGNFYTIL